MSLTLPSIGDVQLDQYGRMYTVHTSANGETVLPTPMGANDDGGEGFNARLFLVNFPAREYLIAVSGAPNPSPVGTFTISLTDVSEDDFSADATNAGALVVGGSVSGNLEAPGDVDWFAVSLTANAEYVVEVRGALTRDGTLGQPRVAGIHDSAGTMIDGTSNNVGAHGSYRNTTREFTPSADGIHYIAAGSFTPYLPNKSDLPVGTYTISVSERS